MAFRRNSYEQIGLRETLLPLSEKEREALDKSWARDFADKIFPLLDETEFIPSLLIIMFLLSFSLFFPFP